MQGTFYSASHPSRSPTPGGLRLEVQTGRLGIIGPKMLFAILAILPLAAATTSQLREWSTPIILDRSGGFQIGGTIISDPTNSTQTLSCDHGYMEYFIPWTPRQTSLVMWHSSSTQVFQNRWDGGQGYKDMFLRRGYPVYLWDGPRVGRANWACEPVNYVPGYRDQSNFAAWNFGPSYKNWWPDVQFPTQDDAAWQQATSARYDEFDTYANVLLHAHAAAIAADSGKVGNSIVYLTNSAGGLRAQMTAIRSNTTNIKGIVTYESIGYVFPDNVNITADTVGGFGPVVVPLAEFKKLAKVPAIQFVWGDHREPDNFYVLQSRRCAALINQYGGNAQVLMLGDDAGLKGSTHIPFADLDNAKVAALLDKFLAANHLDGYLSGDSRAVSTAISPSASQGRGKKPPHCSGKTQTVRHGELPGTGTQTWPGRHLLMVHSQMGTRGAMAEADAREARKTMEEAMRSFIFVV
ncbi:hypothetical protein B0H63DRAFT_511527 [Podospora didyma]|uniref:Alpha/beta-hydrolase n=1 Tax=Podospora didyma TaxID=330526 RepID=A0AAE0TW91_9PEZI|nr:hypothetical protein B0H63DRAFT_511527 [Podospora didyma]